MLSHFHRLTFGYIKFHLSNGFPLSYAGEVFSPEVNVYSFTVHIRLRTEDLMVYEDEEQNQT